MKRLLIALAVLFSCNFLMAQDEMGATDAGNLFLTGASDLTISFADGTPIILNAGVGYFLADDILAGIAVSYFNFDGSSDTDFGLFGRYYVTDALFGGVGVSFDEDFTGDTETNFTLSAGYNIFLSNSVALEPAISFPLRDGADPFIGMGISVFL